MKTKFFFMMIVSITMMGHTIAQNMNIPLKFFSFEKKFSNGTYFGKGKDSSKKVTHEIRKITMVQKQDSIIIDWTGVVPVFDKAGNAIDYEVESIENQFVVHLFHTDTIRKGYFYFVTPGLGGYFKEDEDGTYMVYSWPASPLDREGKIKFNEILSDFFQISDWKKGDGMKME